MNTVYNIYDAKTNFSKIIAMVAEGQTVTIARNGQPIADVTAHNSKKPIQFGTAKGKYVYNQAAFEGNDPEVMELFFGKDWQEM